MLKTYNALINIGGDLDEWMDVVIAAEHEQAMKEKDKRHVNYVNESRAQNFKVFAEKDKEIAVLQRFNNQQALEVSRQAKEIEKLRKALDKIKDDCCMPYMKKLAYEALKQEEVKG